MQHEHESKGIIIFTMSVCLKVIVIILNNAEIPGLVCNTYSIMQPYSSVELSSWRFDMQYYQNEIWICEIQEQGFSVTVTELQ
jgi:hypothetical protein